MSRKPALPVKHQPQAATPFAVQEQTAQVHLEKGRYRDAVACFKALLKSERRPEWVAGLASAYGGRARALAATGMMQEAIGLWRSRAELCGTPLWQGPYATWLVNAGRLDEVLDHLSRLRGTVGGATLESNPDDEIAQLEAQLAPALLSASETALARLSPESLVVRHRPLALAALTAYADQDAAALETALAGISFRSPYRDLRSLLKAMVLCETDQPAAHQAINRVPVDGPFEALAAPVRVVLLNGLDRLRHWAKLNAAQQAMALDLMGCPPALAPLLRAMATQDVNLVPVALFDLVQKNSRDLPEALATDLWQWLAPWAKRRGCDNPRIFGEPTPSHQECATALAVEITGDWDHAETHWLEAVARLQSDFGTHDWLRAALILRHIALSPSHLSADAVLDQQGQEMLTQSLGLDIDDANAHVRVSSYWRQAGDFKRARSQLDLALKHFPDDVVLMTEAVETDLAAGAFKRAITTAQRLLALDPLNRKVRTLVGNAHLSHAIKQIAGNKLEAAKNEIRQAANWLDAPADQARMQLLQAWAEPAGCDERLRLARLAATTWGGGLAAGWRVMREAPRVFARLGQPLATSLLGEAGIDTAKVLTVDDLLALVQALEQESPLIQKGSDPLAPWRKAIAALASNAVLEAPTTVRICEALNRHQEKALLHTFASAARTRWPDQPIFVYHCVAARFHPQSGIDNDRDYDDLENAHGRARQAKDMRLALRIEGLLENDAALDEFGASDGPDLPDLPNLPGAKHGPGRHFDPSKLSPDELRAMFQEMSSLGGAKAFLKIARQDLGETIYKQVERDCAGDKQVVLRRLIDLVVEEFSQTIKPTPPVPSKPLARPSINHPKTPDSGQGNLFNE